MLEVKTTIDTAATNDLENIVMRYQRLCGFIGSLSHGYMELLNSEYQGEVNTKELDRIGWELSYIKEDSERILKELEKLESCKLNLSKN